MPTREAAVALAKLTGDRELIAKLDRLANKDARRIARKAIGSGLATFRTALRGAVPPAETPGHTGREFRKNIRSRFKRNRRAGVTEGKVGAGVGSRKSVAARSNNAPHFHLYVLGTKERTSRGGSRGSAKPHDFIRTTAGRLERAVLRHMLDILSEEITKAAVAK